MLITLDRCSLTVVSARKELSFADEPEVKIFVIDTVESGECTVRAWTDTGDFFIYTHAGNLVGMNTGNQENICDKIAHLLR